MVIYISKENVDALMVDKDFNLFIDLLMMSYREGKHIVVIEPKVVKHIISSNRFSGTTLDFLKHYDANYSKSALESVRFFDYICEVVPNNLEEESFKDENLKTFYRINIKHFTDSVNFQKTVLLGENMNDLDVYLLMAEYFRNKFSLKSFKLSYYKQGGGGSTVLNEFKNIFNLKYNFCICILDSDKKTPNCTIGATAKSVIDFHQENITENFKCYSYVLDVHEIENLLPRKFYIDFFEKKDTNKAGIFMQIDWLCNRNPEARYYLDFKKGLKLLLNYDNQNFETYWGNVVLESGIKPLWDNEYNRYYFKGYGENIVKEFIDSKDNFSITDYISTDLIEKKWVETGKLLGSFIMGTQPIRAT